ncbi:hypothetical protein TrCOL_g2829 [Triparma columacea]|uniref:Ribonuclease H n=1 Tax=Triparma columacea TaxID=722753 RepID=A0A9W7GAP8_9STRA|nr:hypothetical protein TrCOL_g2829 [Triparma columacea]
MPKKKFYAVVNGVKPGIYDSWPTAEKQVKGFPGAIFKGFKSEGEARVYLETGNGSSAASVPTHRKKPSKTPTSTSLSSTPLAPEFVCDGSNSGKRRRRTGSFNSTSSTEPLHLQMNYDGGTRGNGGKNPQSGSGCVVTWRVDGGGPCLATKPHWKSIERFDFLPEARTNNEAEYDGCIRGLREALRIIKEGGYRMGEVILTVEGDSKLVTEHLNGFWECKAVNLQPLLSAARSLILEITEIIGLSAFKIQHVMRERNKIADRLVNEAIDSKGCKRTVVTNEERKEDEETLIDLVKAEAEATGGEVIGSTPPPPPPPLLASTICFLCSLVRERNILGFRDSVSLEREREETRERRDTDKPCCSYNSDPYAREMFADGIRELDFIRTQHPLARAVGVEVGVEVDTEVEKREQRSSPDAPRTPKKPANLSPQAMVSLSPEQRERIKRKKEEARVKREAKATKAKNMTWL